MVRAAALSALSAHSSPEAAQVARAALADEYPRVRMAAAQALAKTPGSIEVLAKHATRDRWAMVRAAALDALGDQSGAESVLQRGLGDPSRLPRAAAVRALTKRRVRSVWPAIKAKLENRDEWPEVLIEGIAYARTMCQADAGKPLLGLLRRGLKPDAWTRDVDVATLALEALLELGGQPAKDALLLARSPTAPVGFRAAAERVAAQPPRCASAKAPSQPAAR
jgi:HEAT repeat protein